ncbi:hypothetical protein P885DRAFT_77126 [Corynascus similis CBS 632.67]
MPPKERTANFRTYEAQSRLLAALVASLEGHRFDYKKIAEYHGGGVTESAMEHKFRLARAQADLIKLMVANNRDPGDYDIPNVTKAEIQKFFGASTPDGLGFQFRGIKKGSDVLKNAVEKGDDPVDAFARFLKGGSGGTGSVPATPSTTKRARSTKATASGSGANPSSKRHKTIKIEHESDDDDDSPEVDYSQLDATPTKPKPKPAPPNLTRVVPQSSRAGPASTPKAAPRQVPIAPAPPPAAPSYSLAPIAGLGSPALPDGYTDPVTSFSYNMAPPTNMECAAQSAASSQVIRTAPARRGSTYSTGSFSAASSPATPSLSYPDPSPSPIKHTGANNMHLSMGTNTGSQHASMPGTADDNTGLTVSLADLDTTTTMPTSNIRSFGTKTSQSATSPRESTSDMPTPQTTTSSNTTTAATPGTHAALTTSFEASQEFRTFNGYTSAANGHHIGRSSNRGYSSFDQREAELAAQVDFGGFEDQDEEGDYDDAGEV